MKYKHLTEKDLAEGTEIVNLVEGLDEESKKLIIVYAGALRDKSMMEKKQTA